MHILFRLITLLSALRDRSKHLIYRFHPNVYLDPTCKLGWSTKLEIVCLKDKPSKVLFIGANTHIKNNTILGTRGGVIRIGSGCSINPFCVLLGYGGITIGNKVRIATQTVLVAFNHNYEDNQKAIIDQGNRAKGIIIKDNVWIGAAVKILDGVTIEEGCVIAAGAVVTKSFPKNSVIAGVPARILKKR